MISEIEDLIKSKMNIVKISIADFSNNHKNHPGNSGGGHYQAIIISDDFKDLSLLERHKKIYSIPDESLLGLNFLNLFPFAYTNAYMFQRVRALQKVIP